MKVAQDLIKDKDREVVSVPTVTTIAEAVALMDRENVGCVLVTEDGAIVGIWTERDLARDVAGDGFDIHSAQIGSYMSHPLITCEWSDSVYSLMDKFLGLRIRHLVVVREGRHIGLISAGDVMRATVHEKDRELAEANANMSWHYYEEWKHK
ncbi:MAG: CBS domain-containing protein [Kiritimatiellia bacterium]|jgi:CBS domain-containing protein|nr:CBS domain-containing protein [Kiritimatiellia bacterium]MDP6631305.1 CBS domain-containing protein [Kiritimatiellia bacterium]MDP6809636.1 CBS domain-containing protein [Kiritimatiellia bacterium]MDP7023513.1 CBS domain-containing protein [Kiritimatiellia bacterium]